MMWPRLCCARASNSKDGVTNNPHFGTSRSPVMGREWLIPYVWSQEVMGLYIPALPGRVRVEPVLLKKNGERAQEIRAVLGVQAGTLSLTVRTFQELSKNPARVSIIDLLSGTLQVELLWDERAKLL